MCYKNVTSKFGKSLIATVLGLAVMMSSTCPVLAKEDTSYKTATGLLATLAGGELIVISVISYFFYVHHKKIESLEELCNMQEKQINAQSGLIAVLESGRKTLDDGVAMFEKREKSVSEQLENAVKERDKYRSEAFTLRLKNENLLDCINSGKELNKCLEKELRDFRGRLRAGTLCEKAEDLFNELNSKIEKLNRQIADLESQIKAKEQQIKNLSEKLKSTTNPGYGNESDLIVDSDNLKNNIIENVMDSGKKFKGASDTISKSDLEISPSEALNSEEEVLLESVASEASSKCRDNLHDNDYEYESENFSVSTETNKKLNSQKTVEKLPGNSAEEVVKDDSLNSKLKDEDLLTDDEGENDANAEVSQDIETEIVVEEDSNFDKA